MAMRFIPTTRDGVEADVDGDLWVVMDRSILSNLRGAGFDFLATSDSTLVVSGSVYGEDHGVRSGPGSASNTVYVDGNGLVYGLVDGIEMDGSSHLVSNLGEITADIGWGIHMRGDSGGIFNGGYILGSSGGVWIQGDDFVFSNTGTVTAFEVGVCVEGTGNDLSNSGLITGEYGVRFDTQTAQSNALQNTGTIQTLELGGVAVQGGAGDDTVVNAGMINGDVLLGGGSDTYDGLFGTLIGVVDGGDGKDWLSGSLRDDELYGGLHNDRIWGERGEDTLEGGGGADIIRGGDGDDEIRGGGRRDTLIGGLGDDVMEGNGGDDTLNGRSGDDFMIGGKGADTFIFGQDADSDVIADFEHGEDLIDLSSFDTDFDAVDAAISSKGDDARIDLGQLGGDGIIVVRDAAGLLDASDFIL